MLVANDSRRWPSAPNAEPGTSATPVSLLGLSQIHGEAAILMPGADLWEPDLHELGDVGDFP